ncbi:MAG: DUF2059 domain-containing protein [Desulfuromonadales bacterium]|nr:DUF2059 domain-containing protein [Desulfuromonadales bacterium]
MKKRILLVALVLLALIPGRVLADDPATDKAATIRAIMALAEVDDLTRSYGKTMAEQIHQVLQTSRPEMPADAMVIIREEVEKQLAIDRDQLLTQIAAIFDRTFTTEEIAELYRFYQTELGKKSLALMPRIMQENLEIGRRWGQEVGPALRARLEARFKQGKPHGAH